MQHTHPSSIRYLTRSIIAIREGSRDGRQVGSFKSATIPAEKMRRAAELVVVELQHGRLAHADVSEALKVEAEKLQ